MGDPATTRPYLRFGLASIIVVGAVAAGFSFVALGMRSHRHDQVAARAAAGATAAPFAQVFSGLDLQQPVPDGVRGNADALLLKLALGDLEGVRVSTPAGAVLYEAGASVPAGPLPADSSDLVAQQLQDDAGAELLVTRSVESGLVVETVHDATALEITAGVDWVLVALVAAFALVGVALLQLAFWWGIHSFARAHGHLSNLYDTGQELRSSLDLHDVLSRLATDAARIADAQYAVVALFDEATSEVVLRAAWDGDAQSVSLHQKAIDDWFVRRCVATNTTITSDQSAGAFRTFFGSEAAIEKNGWVLCAPMALRDRVIGAIAVLRAGPGRGAWSPDDTCLVEQLAAQAVTAVEQSILFAKVRSDAQELESSYDSTLKALMAALDAKDEVTEGHCERVARITIELARRMGIPETMMIHIERGSLLHDVGKIGVPDGILKKPRALTDTEWEAMRKHPLLAGLMVSKIGFLEPALPILLYHHERFDGTGYPFGLAGDNIPTEARVFSVIDAYDAMTSDRPYRPAMTHAAAMDEVRRNSGTQFDPVVVAAFEELMAERRDLREPTGRRVLGMHDLEELQSDSDQHVA